MPTRKQQRRRAKTFRHEFDYVMTDDEGNPVPVDPTELRAEKEKAAPPKAKANGKGGKQQAGGKRPPREVAPPSWNRSLRRGLPMGAVILVVMLLLFQNLPLPLRVLYGLLYAVAFVPITYALDRMTYRRYLRREGKL
jgi:hypothetical protein